MGETILFFILAIIAIASGIGMLTNRNAVHAALFLVLNFATIAVFYLILQAPFVAMVQITVYAGAIMVLFLFVIMLLGAEKLQGARLSDVQGRDLWQRIVAGILGLALLAVFVIVMVQGTETGTSASASALDASPTDLGLRLFAAYVFPFEVTGVLLLTAMIGVVVLSKRKKGGADA